MRWRDIIQELTANRYPGNMQPPVLICKWQSAKTCNAEPGTELGTHGVHMYDRIELQLLSDQEDTRCARQAEPSGAPPEAGEVRYVCLLRSMRVAVHTPVALNMYIRPFLL